MEIPQKFIQMACNKICNKFGKKKNKNKHKKINCNSTYAEFIRAEGKGNYSKGIVAVCNELVATRIMLDSNNGEEDLKRTAVLSLTEKFLHDLSGVDPTFIKKGFGNLPAFMNLHFQGQWKPEVLHSHSEDEGDAYHG